MKRGLVFTATLAALSLGIVACQQKSGGGGKAEVPDISINNKDAFEADWFVEDADKPLQITIADGTPVADAIYDGDLIVTSDEPNVVSVTSSMLAVHAEAAGTATVTATYKGKKSDSVQIEVKVRPSMRVATSIDTTKDDYLMGWKVAGEKIYAKDEMNGFYIGTATIDNASPISVQLDDNPSGDYKYTIKIGDKMIGAYKGSHNNIGFVGDQVDDGGPKDLVKALFKFNSNFTFSTNFFGSTDYFLAAYKGTSNDRLAFQTGDGIANDAFARLYEYGDPIPATAISITPTEASVHAGATVKLEAAVTPANSTDEVVWVSHQPSLATVDQSGLVTGVAESAQNEVTITATAGSVSATATITVTEALNYGTEENPLTVAQAKAFLDANFPSSTTVEEMYVTGTVSSATYSTKYSNWEIWLYDGETARGFELYSTTLANGLDSANLKDGAVVKAHGYAKIYNGTYELTNNKVGTSTVYPQVYFLEFTAPALEGVAVAPASASVDIANGEATKQFTATPVPATAELGEVTWTVTPDNAGVTVDGNGLVTVAADAVADDQEAEFEIRATVVVGEGTEFATATLTVTNSTGGGGTIEPDVKISDLANGATVTDLKARVMAVGSDNKNFFIDDGYAGILAYASAATTGISAGDCVTVSGTVSTYNKALQIGSATIAKSQDAAPTPTTATALTAENAATMLSSNPTPIGGRYSLRTGVVSASGNYLVWSFGSIQMENGARCTAGMQAGKVYDIEGYIGGIYSTYLLFVPTAATEVAIDVEGIALDKTEANVRQGATLQLNASATPAGAQFSSTVQWSTSDATGKISVSSTGLVSVAADATVGATATITAMYNAFTATCEITVEEASTEPEPVTVTIDLSAKTTSIAKPEAASDTPHVVAWGDYSLNLINAHNSGGSYAYMMLANKQLGNVANSLISNHVAIDGSITKITFTAPSGSSGSAVYAAALSTTEITTAITSIAHTRTGAGDLVITADAEDGFSYFGISNTANKYNGQITTIVIEYIPNEQTSYLIYQESFGAPFIIRIIVLFLLYEI